MLCICLPEQHIWWVLFPSNGNSGKAKPKSTTVLDHLKFCFYSTWWPNFSYLMWWFQPISNIRVKLDHESLIHPSKIFVNINNQLWKSLPNILSLPSVSVHVFFHTKVHSLKRVLSGFGSRFFAVRLTCCEIGQGAKRFGICLQIHDAQEGLLSLVHSTKAW